MWRKLFWFVSAYAGTSRWSECGATSGRCRALDCVADSTYPRVMRRFGVGAVVLALVLGACSSSNSEDRAATSTSRVDRQRRLPRPQRLRATCPPHADDRVVVSGDATLDGKRVDSRWVGAVVLHNGLQTPCQVELPPVTAGRYAVPIHAASESAGSVPRALASRCGSTRATASFSAPTPLAGRPALTRPRSPLDTPRRRQPVPCRSRRSSRATSSTRPATACRWARRSRPTSAQRDAVSLSLAGRRISRATWFPSWSRRGAWLHPRCAQSSSASTVARLRAPASRTPRRDGTTRSTSPSADCGSIRRPEGARLRDPELLLGGVVGLYAVTTTQNIWVRGRQSHASASDVTCSQL